MCTTNFAILDLRLTVYLLTVVKYSTITHYVTSMLFLINGIIDILLCNKLYYRYETEN